MKKILSIALIFVCGLFVCGTPVEVQLKDRACTKENVYMAIREIGISFPDLVFSQTMLESAELKSKLSVSNNNIFGMRLAKKRPTTAIGERNGYAVYTSWYACLLDYYEYQRYMLKEHVTTKNRYMALLGRRYAEDKHYIVKLKRNMRENREFIIAYDSVYQSLAEPQMADVTDAKL